MQIGLSGDHPDALALTVALVNTGRHRLVRSCCSPGSLQRLKERGIPTVAVTDRDALFSDPEVEVLILGDTLAERADVLRRAVRSEKHVLCVHPVDLLPDVAYEAAFVQEETGKVLLPLLWDRLHPGLRTIAELVRTGRLGRVTLLEAEFSIPEESWSAPAASSAKVRKRREPVDPRWDRHPALRVWDSIRFLAGEVLEVSAVGAAGEQLTPLDTLTLTGRCQTGCLFRLLMTRQGPVRDRLIVRGETGEAVLTYDAGSSGSAQAVWRWEDQTDQATWHWQPWPDLACEVEKALAGMPPAFTWLDETRCLEVFDAVRQSVRRRRVIPLEYEEVSEGANFKTVMTTLGCLTLVLVLVLFVALLALGLPLVPWTLYLLLPLLLIFLALQILGWVIPASPTKENLSGNPSCRQEQTNGR